MQQQQVNFSFSNLSVLKEKYHFYAFSISIKLNDLKQANLQEAREQSIERSIQSLVHASRCQEQHCHQPHCMKMKRVIAHVKKCRKRHNDGCRVCKQLLALCCKHAKDCNEVECSVAFCPNFKQKIEQQQQFSDEMNLLIESMQNIINGDLDDMEPLIQSMHNMLNDDESPQELQVYK